MWCTLGMMLLTAFTLLQTISNTVEEKAKWIFNKLKGASTKFYFNLCMSKYRNKYTLEMTKYGRNPCFTCEYAPCIEFIVTCHDTNSVLKSHGMHSNKRILECDALEHFPLFVCF